MNFIYKGQTTLIIKRCNYPFCGQKRVAIGDAIDQALKAAEKKYPQKAFYF